MKIKSNSFWGDLKVEALHRGTGKCHQPPKALTDGMKRVSLANVHYR